MSVIHARGQSDEGSRPPATPWKIHMYRNTIEVCVCVCVCVCACVCVLIVYL